MAPSIQCLSHLTVPIPEAVDQHISKKRRLVESSLTAKFEDESNGGNARERIDIRRNFQETQQITIGVPPHPLGIKPSGNAYDARINIKTSAGFFAYLPDELLLNLLDYLSAADLVNLGGTCKALYAFSAAEELWKALFVESSPKTFEWQGSWRNTFLHLPSDSPKISCHGLYSDTLYLPFHRAHVPLAPLIQNIPTRNQITRLPDLTPDDFNASWASRPFILTDPVRTWPVYKEWSAANLLSRYGDTVFRAEAVDWPFKTYMEYVRHNADESPLYLFDCRFAEKMQLTVAGDAESSQTTPTAAEPSYTPPLCFTPDLFTALGSHRPDHRWLIIGPARSGSTFHADPNGTSAWNAVIRGRKYWIMFPPSTDLANSPLPGLHISEDSSHITAPLSIAEYMLSFFDAARAHPGCIEAVCHEGEVLHVPSGWYHMVLNLEDGIALTQNFVPPPHLPGVLAFLRDRREQVSGFVESENEVEAEGKEYELFVDKLRETYPEILQEALEELRRRDEKKSKKSRWDELTGKAGVADDANDTLAPEDGGFSFGFAFENASGDDVYEELGEDECGASEVEAATPMPM